MSGIKPTMKEVIDVILDQLKERATSLSITSASTVSKVHLHKLLFEVSSAKNFS